MEASGLGVERDERNLGQHRQLAHAADGQGRVEVRRWDERARHVHGSVATGTVRAGPQPLRS
jgi:hypothetical protein